MTLFSKNQRNDPDALSEEEFDILMFAYLEGDADDPKPKKLIHYLREPFYMKRFVERCRQDLLVYQLVTTKPPQGSRLCSPGKDDLPCLFAGPDPAAKGA